MAIPHVSPGESLILIMHIHHKLVNISPWLRETLRNWIQLAMADTPE
jgi:hypothetical protein